MRKRRALSLSLRAMGAAAQNQPVRRLKYAYQAWLTRRPLAAQGRASRRLWKLYAALASMPTLM